jgi:hypothetical protein
MMERSNCRLLANYLVVPHLRNQKVFVPASCQRSQCGAVRESIDQVVSSLTILVRVGDGGTDGCHVQSAVVILDPSID